MKRIAVVITLIILMLVVLPVGAAHASANFDRVIGEGETVHEDLVIFGGSLEVKEGATVDGDVSVFGGTANLAGDVSGDVVIFGGQVDLSGEIGGDLVIFGGSLKADSSADVDGECILIGGSLTGDGASGINCAEVGEELPQIAIPPILRPPSSPSRPEQPERPEVPVPPIQVSNDRGFFGTISAITGRSLLLGLLALAIAYLAPAQLGRVGETLGQKPAVSGAVGLLSVIAVPTLIVILLILSALLTIVCIGLLGFPIALAMAIALAAGSVMGWVAAGVLLGRKLASWLKMSNRSLPVTAALGTASLTLAAGLLSALPFLLGGWFFWIAGILICCAGLGAVALTRFGTRPYPMVAVADDNSVKVDMVLETLPTEDEDHLDSDQLNEKPPVE